MKHIGNVLTILAVCCLLFTGCGKTIIGENVLVIDDDGTNVTYRLQCSACKHTYSQDHIYPLYKGTVFEADLMCDYCGETMHILLQRK